MLVTVSLIETLVIFENKTIENNNYDCVICMCTLWFKCIPSWHF